MAKYRNKGIVLFGHKFASQKEGKRYLELRARQEKGEIHNLTLQPRYGVHVNGMKVCDYIADFEYVDTARGGICVVEDVKGMRTPVYRLKQKLVRAVLGIIVEEV